jgi:flavin-dependent dehydrogenase
VDRGAIVQTGVRVDGQRIDELHKENIIVGADGILSAVAKHFSMGSISKYILTYKAEFNIEVRDAKTVDLFFDNSIAPKFFAWLCPNSKDILEVGIGIDAKYGNSKTAFERFVAMKEVRDQIDVAKMLEGYASMIPMQTLRRVVDAEKEVVLVGDAAGQVKPTTGGGIVFGGNAARLAAKVIEEHIRLGTSLEKYEKLFRKGFGTDIKLHSALNKIYSGLDSKKLEFLIKMSKSLGFESFLANYGDMDKPSVMLKRFFLRGLTK